MQGDVILKEPPPMSALPRTPPHTMFIIILYGIKQLNKLWKKTFLKYSPTVMFRWTPCIIRNVLIDT